MAMSRKQAERKLKQIKKGDLVGLLVSLPLSSSVRVIGIVSGVKFDNRPSSKSTNTDLSRTHTIYFNHSLGLLRDISFNRKAYHHFRVADKEYKIPVTNCFGEDDVYYEIYIGKKEVKHLLDAGKEYGAALDSLSNHGVL